MVKRGLFKNQGTDKLKKRVGIALVILIFALIIFTGYFLFFYPKVCSDSACFSDAMRSCKHVSWIKKDAQADWIYIIKGNAKGDTCKVEVTLKNMKAGTIDSEALQGKKMLCTVLKSETNFPEKDISRCSGELKEELQDRIIQRMHSYLLENVGEIQEEFAGI